MGPAGQSQAVNADAKHAVAVPADETAADEASRLKKFRKHLHAWWEGYYVDNPHEQGEQPSQPPVTEEDKKNDKWSLERIKVAELIWGDGFTFPGGADHVLQMVKPMTLTSAKSMLDIGCGLGGATRAIAKTFGTWVIGMEESP